MTATKAIPIVSEGWRQEIFNSQCRIDVEKTAKATTRHPVNVGWTGELTYANGGHERIAMLILEQLYVVGEVKRWKAQPFNLNEIGGPNVVPDLMVELRSLDLHVVECKAKRFITPEIQAKFDVEREFLQGKGFGFHVWTNRDRLSSATSHTVAELERGRLYPPTPERVRQIGKAAESAKSIGDLTAQFGWDDTLSAAALNQFHFDFLVPLNETTPIQLHPARDYADRLFAPRHAHAGWWDQLRAAGPEDTRRLAPE